MKISFYISVAASGLCLLLSIIVFAVGTTNQGLQTDIQQQQQKLQQQQAQIQQGQVISQRVGPALLQEMAQVSVKNEKMKALLGKHGYTVNVEAPASPAPGAKPAPTAPPPAPTAPATPPAGPDGAPALR